MNRFRVAIGRGRVIIISVSMVAFGAIGLLLLNSGSAATFTAHIEAESGQLSGSHGAGPSSGASGGSSVDGSYLMVYSGGGAFTANLNKLSGTVVKAYWFNPRTGQSVQATVDKGTAVSLTPPDNGDWVFVADDAARNYPSPGM